MKIIRHLVNHDRTSNDFIQTEPFVIEHLVGISLIAHQWRQISCMLWVRHAGGIVVIAGLIKRSLAVAGFMDMESVEVTGALYIDIGKAKDFSFDQDAAVRGLVEFDRAGNLRLRSVALNPGDGIWLCLIQKI